MSYEALASEAGRYLEADESALSAIGGTCHFNAVGHHRSSRGVLLATERRLVFYGASLAGYVVSELGYSQVSSIQHGKRFLISSVMFAASGSSLKMDRVRWGDAAEFTSVVRQRVAAMAMHGLGAELEKLASLRDRRILSKEEFELKKRLLLGVTPAAEEPARSAACPKDGSGAEASSPRAGSEGGPPPAS